MSKHAAPIVVRLWKDGYTEPSIDALVSDWVGGSFTLSLDHPLAKELWRNVHKRTYILTVLSTDELEWDPYQVTAASRLLIRCTPRHERLRLSLISDDYLIATKGIE
jgi:hypothetical protein